MWVRLQALPYDSPLSFALRGEQDKAEPQRVSREIDDTLDMIRNPKPASSGGGGA